jgi:dTDP-4-dehydrorhamnose 3,5-epimerase
VDFRDGAIEGVVVRPLKLFSDERGWLSELFRHDEMDADIQPAMAYFSLTYPGVQRGPHVHMEQTDYFVFYSSTFRIVLWDDREVSATHMNRMMLHMGRDDPGCVIVPPGVVHAYRNIGDGDGMIINFPNRLFAGRDKKEDVDEIRYEDDPNSVYRMDL